MYLWMDVCDLLGSDEWSLNGQKISSIKVDGSVILCFLSKKKHLKWAHVGFSTCCCSHCCESRLWYAVSFSELVIWIWSSSKLCMWFRLINGSNVVLQNRHKSKRDCLLKSRWEPGKKWHFLNEWSVIVTWEAAAAVVLEGGGAGPTWRVTQLTLALSCWRGANLHCGKHVHINIVNQDKYFALDLKRFVEQFFRPQKTMTVLARI